MAAWIVWVVVGLACLAIETVTLGFVVAFFGAGALAAAAAAGLGAPVLGQVGVFAITSFALLGFTRRLFLDWFHQRDDPERPAELTLVGRTGTVTVEITSHGASGQIRIGTEYWTARLAPPTDGGDPDADRAVPVGATVQIAEIRGVTALVVPRELPPAEA